MERLHYWESLEPHYFVHLRAFLVFCCNDALIRSNCQPIYFYWLTIAAILLYYLNQINSRGLFMQQKQAKTQNLIMSSLFTALIILGTFIKIPIPVVPFTLQFLFANLAALLLGSRYGSLSVLVYVILGLLGVPIFASGGGIAYIFHPTFGYLIGFIVGSYLAGRIIEKSERTGIKTLLSASFANLAVVYALGMQYYYFLANYYLNTPIGVGALMLYCFVLAVPGDILLCFLSAELARRLRPIVEKGGVSR